MDAKAGGREAAGVARWVSRETTPDAEVGRRRMWVVGSEVAATHAVARQLSARGGDAMEGG